MRPRRPRNFAGKPRPAVEPLERRRLLSTTYYVSPAGKDANPGTSAALPLRTLADVDRLVLAAGDQVLLAGGSTFPGTLALTAADGGTAADPITVSSYGTGRATIDAGGGDGIDVLDTAGVDISNLTLIGTGAATFSGVGAGIQLTNDLPGDVKLDHVHIADVDVSGFGFVGIAIGGTTDGRGGGSGFNDVRITDSGVHGNVSAGVFSYAGAFRANPAPYGLAHTNVYVGDVRAYGNTGYAGPGDSGNGIELGNVDGGTVEHCVADDNGTANTSTGGGPVGIWAYDSNAVAIQHNESYGNTAAHKDGGGFDLDGGCTNCVLQYNYSHDNAGAGVLLCEFPAATAWSGNVVRYNVSQDDGRRNNYAGLDLWTPDDTVPLTDSQVYGNTVFMADADGSAPIGLLVDGATENVGIYNNVFDVAAGLSPVVVTDAGVGLALAGNDYWAGAGARLNVDWLGTTYDGLPDWRAATGQETLGGVATGLSVDPALVDAGGGTTPPTADALAGDLPAYRLTAGSPLVDAGVSLTALGIDPGPTDFYGVPLPQGAGFDVGAAEFLPTATGSPTGTPTSTTPPAVATDVTVTASTSAPVTAGSAVTLVAAVSAVTAAVPTGTVTFTLADGTPLGTAAVSADGTAALTTTALPVGVDAASAAYGGDAAHAAATAPAAAVVTVNPRALSPTVVRTTVPATAVAAAPRVRGTTTVTVANAASATESGPVKIELFAAPTGVLDGSAVAVATVTRRLSLKVGRSATLTIPVPALPAALTPGTYAWLARVTDGAGLASVSPAGPLVTVAAATVTLTATARSPGLPTTIVAGRRVGRSAAVSVSNTGNSASTAPLSVTLYLSASGVLDAAAVAVGTARKATTVRPGRRAVPVAVPWSRVPATATAGSYTLLALVTDATGHTAVTNAIASVNVTAGAP